MAFPSLREDASSLEKTSSLLSKPPGTEQSHEGHNTLFFFSKVPKNFDPFWRSLSPSAAFFSVYSSD